MAKVVLPETPQVGVPINISPRRAIVWNGDAYGGRERSSRILVDNGAPNYSTYERPQDWLTMPDMSAGQASGGFVGFVGLVAVRENIATSATVLAEGNYVVDWGDGAVEQYASGARATHRYNYATYDVNGDTTCSRGYKQALLKIYPQEGQQLTRLNLCPLGNRQPLNQILDFSIYAPDLNYFIGVSGGVSGGTSIYDSVLELAAIYKSALLSVVSLFENCIALKEVLALDIGTATDITRLFYNCSVLEYVPTVETANVTTANNAFNGCRMLRFIPKYDFSSLTSAQNFAAGCYKLEVLHPNWFVNGGVLTGAFYSCYNISGDYTLNLVSGMTISSFLAYTRTINSVTLSGIFTVNQTGIFVGSDVKKVKIMNTGDGTINGTSFSNCRYLEELEFLDGSKWLGTSGAFGFFNLRRLIAPGFVNNLNLGGRGKFTAEGLNEFFESLGTVSGKEITITNQPGAATCNRSIATAKGWTIIG